MKLRRLIAAVLALTLCLGLAAQAASPASADERLAQVTLAVKNILDIDDDYTQFYGEPNESYLGTRWELDWSDEDRQLHVSADDKGKVISMSLWETKPEPVTRPMGYGPAFPPMSRAQAKTIAEAFLAKVLDSYETAQFNETGMTGSLSAESYTFRGTICLNGLPSPLSFTVRVRLSDGTVTSFWQGTVSDYVDDLPAPHVSVTAERAAELFKPTHEFRLEYVLDDPESKQAVLRYLPENRHDYYVDASGKLVDLTELRQALYRGDTGGGAAYDTAAEAPAAMAEASLSANKQLSQVELEGVSKLEGALDQSELDKKVKAWKQLSLEGFELVGCNYNVEREEISVSPVVPRTAQPVSLVAISSPAATPVPAVPSEPETEAKDTKVTAYLTYAKKVGDRVSRRNVTVDAKTGELFSMGGYNAYDDTPAKLTKSAAKAKAAAFLKVLWGDQFAKTELYSSTDSDKRICSDAWVFTFAQKVNGYFFPQNSITVRISADDGAVMGFSKYFDDEVTFDSAEGLVSKESAREAWAASFPVELRYIEVPVKLDLLGAKVRPLISAGFSYYNSLKPGYTLGRQSGWCRGVDAKTGEVIRTEETAPEVMEYSDLDGHWAQAALNELALYNVGWWGGKADPDATLTQLDYLALLASAEGYRFSALDGANADELYAYAVRRGLLTEEERDDTKALTRADMIRMLLDSLGYKDVANIPGIFRCDYSDAGQIPAAHMGYAALAQGLGLISGGLDSRYAPERTSTRAEAAMMLWKYMKR